MSDHMKRLSRSLLLAVLGLMTALGCERQESVGNQQGIQTDAPVSNYIYDGEEFPVHSITSVDNGSQIVVKISPMKNGEKQTTYAAIGINASLEGREIDVERAWSNDDYYFIYETPLMYYSQYRSLKSGTVMIRRLSVEGEYEIIADVILPDGKDFKFEYTGICLQD